MLSKLFCAVAVGALLQKDCMEYGIFEPIENLLTFNMCILLLASHESGGLPGATEPRFLTGLSGIQTFSG